MRTVLLFFLYIYMVSSLIPADKFPIFQKIMSFFFNKSLKTGKKSRQCLYYLAAYSDDLRKEQKSLLYGQLYKDLGCGDNIEQDQCEYREKVIDKQKELAEKQGNGDKICWTYHEIDVLCRHSERNYWGRIVNCYSICGREWEEYHEHHDDWKKDCKKYLQNK